MWVFLIEQSGLQFENRKEKIFPGFFVEWFYVDDLVSTIDINDLKVRNIICSSVLLAIFLEGRYYFKFRLAGEGNHSASVF